MALGTGNYISICTGGYGLDLGVDLATGGEARAVCLVENEATAAALLVHHMEAGRIHPAPLWSDLRTFDFRAWRGKVSGLVGGYPCQPFSNAGKRLGADDPRHLWPVIEQGIADLQPEWCFFENVGAHLRLGFREVAGSLHGLGYRVAAVLLTASEVGAPHGRERLFILAHRNKQHDDGRGDAGARGRSESSDRDGQLGGVEHADLPRLEGRRVALDGGADEWLAWPPGPTDADAWRRVIAARPDLAPATQPPVRGMADGLAGGLGRSDQLHILGNGVVPQQAAYAMTMLMEALGE